MLKLVVLLFGKLFDKLFLRSTTTTTTTTSVAAAAAADDDDDDNDDDVRRSYLKTTTLLTSIDQWATAAEIFFCSPASSAPVEPVFSYGDPVVHEWVMIIIWSQHIMSAVLEYLECN